jgi:hypothetical protein
VNETESLGEKGKARVFTYRGRHQSGDREGASSGQVEAKPRIIIRKKEEKERKGIIKVAFLLPDDTCVRKVDLKANRKERNEK